MKEKDTMKTLKQLLPFAAGVGVLCLAAALGTPSFVQGAPPNATSNVLVVNSEAQPVPTRALGTTSVDGSVSAAQSGPWSVGVTGGVAVSNAPDSPLPTRDVDRVERVPVDIGLHHAPHLTATYTVPAGQRLTIKAVSGFCPNQIVDMYALTTTFGGQQVRHMFPATIGLVSSMGMQTLAFADGGTVVVFWGVYEGPAASDTQGCDLSITGYLSPM